jgi:hypothetical protein
LLAVCLFSQRAALRLPFAVTCAGKHGTWHTRATYSVIIIINPCKPYLSASATAPHPLGRRKAD